MVVVIVYGCHVLNGYTKDFVKSFDSLQLARAFIEKQYKSPSEYTIGEIVRASNGKYIGRVIFDRFALVSKYNNKVVMFTNTIGYQTDDAYPDYAEIIKSGGKMDTAYYLRKVKKRQ